MYSSEINEYVLIESPTRTCLYIEFVASGVRCATHKHGLSCLPIVHDKLVLSSISGIKEQANIVPGHGDVVSHSGVAKRDNVLEDWTLGQGVGVTWRNFQRA